MNLYKNIAHVAIIMDGNRRWAKKNNVSFYHSYKQGIESMKKATLMAIDLGIPYISFFGFSTENWQRDKDEISCIKSILLEYLTNPLFDFFIENKIKVNIIGEFEKFGEDIAIKLKKLMQVTHNFTNLQVNLALNYGGRQEILRAVSKLNADNINTTEITEEVFNKYLYLPSLPDIDLLIRTGGQKRISNFMLWHLFYTEFVFFDFMWPDFTKEDLKKAIDIYLEREKNKGS